VKTREELRGARPTPDPQRLRVVGIGLGVVLVAVGVIVLLSGQAIGVLLLLLGVVDVFFIGGVLPALIRKKQEGSHDKSPGDPSG